MNEKPITAEERARFEEIFSRVPFVQHLGFELVELERGTSILAAIAQPEFLQNHGVLHGGFTAALIDSATAFAIISHLAAGESTTTVDLNIHYLRPILSGRIVASGRVVRAGRRIITAVAEVTDSTDRLCAMASTTYVRLRQDSPLARDTGTVGE
jgi:uncharacterized protein (TIGR00369 family)